jgi:hypothetical protein
MTGSSTSSASESSGGAGPGCGDGVVDDGEECDLGDDNGGAECTAMCTNVVCGDSVVSEGEACDDGDENGTDLGACAPDCSKTVDAKTITVSVDYSTNGDMGGDAVARVDERCESAGLAGYKAMFADGTNRRASVTPYAGDGQIDWALTPWTRYVREDGTLVWVTDESALLGVRDGNPEPLLAPISNAYNRAYTGLQANWLAELTSDCFNWTSNSSGQSTALGEPGEVAIDRVLAGTTTPGNCGISTVVYCVSQ